MKGIALIILSAVASVVSYAADVRYFKGTWSEALTKAAAEHKYLFVDGYTEWCGWCKVMDKETMTNEKVAALLNERFIAVKMDMEKGEGMKLAMKYHVNAFPGYLYFSPDGRYVYQSGGYTKAAPFKDQLEGVLTGRLKVNAPGYNGSLDVEYPQIYTDLYHKRRELTMHDVLEYLDSQDDLFSEATWAVMDKFSHPGKYDSFLLLNKARYAALYGEDAVDRKVSSILRGKLNDAIDSADEVEFNRLLALVDKYDGQPEEQKRYYKLLFYKATKNWNKYAGSATDCIKKEGCSDCYFVNDICWTIYENCDGAKAIKSACSWMAKVVEAEPTYAYLDTYACLLYKAGRNGDAMTYAEKAIVAGKAEEADVKATEKLLKELKTTRKRR